MSRELSERAYNDGWSAAFKRSEAQLAELRAEVERLKEHVSTLQELRELDRKLIALLRASGG